MNIKYFFLKSLIVSGGLMLLFSCGQDNGAKVDASASKQAAVQRQPDPFPFYKNLSVRPGFNFEVLSWGKGVDSLGGYLILMSDSARNDFKSFSNERKGIITDAWNMDLDNDGNPEVYIELLSDKNKLDLNVYEYSRNGFQKITFPGLSSRMKKIYAGNDKFTIKNGDLLRTFPIVNSTDTTQKPGAIKTLRYSLNGNSFSVDEVEVKD
jgi:hypothetical protein